MLGLNHTEALIPFKFWDTAWISEHQKYSFDMSFIKLIFALFLLHIYIQGNWGHNVSGLETACLFVFTLFLIQCYVNIVAAELTSRIHIASGVSSFCSSNNVLTLLHNPNFIWWGDMTKCYVAWNTGYFETLPWIRDPFCFSGLLLELEEDG